MKTEKCKIICKDGAQLLTDTSGNVLPYQVFTRVVDDYTNGKETYAIVKIKVDLVDTKEINQNESTI